MKVLFYAYYLADREIEKRDMDWAPIKIKQWVKGDPINGRFSIIDANGRQLTFREGDRDAFLNGLWRTTANQLKRRFEEPHILVPIPGHAVTVAKGGPYRTLGYAQAIAAHSDGRFTAVDALRWAEEREPQRGTSGWRQPDARYQNLRVIAELPHPVIIVDDVFTSGSSIAAARWRLEEAGGQVAMAACAVRPCHEQLERNTGWFEEDAPVFAKPFF